MSTSDEPARNWSSDDGRVVCGLCPHHCRIDDGRRGICGVRENRGGSLVALTYGRVAAMQVDPIEKKPLNNFMPGTRVLSLGSVGCNLRCRHCQNHHISMARPEDLPLTTMDADDVISLCERRGCPGIAWTYNEPTIWQEFAVDVSRRASEKGLFSVWVTNGFIERGPLEEVCGATHAMNVDVKGFDDDFYRRVCGARLDPVLRTVERAHDLGVHVEVTYLVIPGHNDDDAQLGGFVEWSAGIDREMPVHFNAFHPDYLMMDVPPTPIATLRHAESLAKDAGIDYVYVGNVQEGSDTCCPHCGAVLLERRGLSSRNVGLEDGRCGSCGGRVNVRQHL